MATRASLSQRRRFNAPPLQLNAAPVVAHIPTPEMPRFERQNAIPWEDENIIENNMDNRERVFRASLANVRLHRNIDE